LQRIRLETVHDSQHHRSVSLDPLDPRTQFFSARESPARDRRDGKTPISGFLRERKNADKNFPSRQPRR